MDDLMSKLFPKRGYKLSDKPEFQTVRRFIISNGYSVRNFDINLQTLTFIERPTISEEAQAAQLAPVYKAASNTIRGHVEGADLIHELFHMSSNINDCTNTIGVLFEDGTGESLNEGITDYLTVLAADNKMLSYPVLAYYFQVLIQMYPDLEEEMLKRYFLGKPDNFYDLFGEDRETILTSVRELDKYVADLKYNDLVAIDTLRIYATGSKRKPSSMLSQELLNDELTNACSILIEKCRERDTMTADNIVDEFEDMMFKCFSKEDAKEIIELLHEKVDVRRSL